MKKKADLPLPHAAYGYEIISLLSLMQIYAYFMYYAKKTA